MEIERKFLVRALPDLSEVPFSDLSQAYIFEAPAIRVRKDGDAYELTVKGPGHIAHAELNLPLTEEAYEKLLKKTEGIPVTKRRYRIPYGAYTIELDVFSGAHEGLVIAEVEFPSLAEAEAFAPPSWFGADVSLDPRYKNSYLALHTDT